MRKIVIAGNWKMNKTNEEAIQLVTTLNEELKQFPEAKELEIIVSPPYTAISSVLDLTQSSLIKISAQNLFWEDSGAFTGEVSAPMLKSAGAVWIARYFIPDAFWLHVFAGFFAVIGHNFSIFLLEKDPEGKIKFGGGAGGTPAIGAIIGFWWPSVFILIPVGYLIVMVVGYASLATLSLPLIGSFILLIRFINSEQPWEYIFSGLLSEILIVWALLPNIKRLLNGTERLVGFRAKKKKQDE